MVTEVKHAIRSADGWASMSAPEQAEYAGYYTTLGAWEAALPASLVTADEQHTAVCYNDWPIGASGLTINGLTADSTRYAKIIVAPGHEHGGIPGNGFRIVGSSITAVTPYTQIIGIELDGGAVSSQGAAVLLDRLIVKYTLDSGIVQQGAGSRAINCMIRQSYRGIAASGGGIFNCVAVNCTQRGFWAMSSAVVVKNTLAYNCVSNWVGTFDAASSNNATSSGSDDAPGGSSVYGITSSDFVDAANNDFHLLAGSALIGAGVNLYSTFTTDIDGDEWPSSGAWDIGFDHYVAGVGGTTIEGDAAAQATATGALTTEIPMTGAAAVVATASGAISTGIPVAGHAASVSVAAGVFTTSITFTGTALAQALATAGITTGIPIAGTAAGQAGGGGSLSTGSGGADLAGAARSMSSSVASLTTQISLSGAALAKALASAGLATTPSGFGSDAQARAGAHGALLTGIPLAATPQAYSTAAGGLTTMIMPASAAASVSSASGALTIEATYTGAALASALASGDLTTIIRLDVAALAQAAASGILGAATQLPGVIPHRVAASRTSFRVESRAATWKISATA